MGCRAKQEEEDVYFQCFFFFSGGMRVYAYPLNILQTSYEKYIHFCNFEVYAIQLLQPACWLFSVIISFSLRGSGQPYLADVEIVYVYLRC